MRTLHVAALPFPSQQGTQAALHAMLCALSAQGQSPELLCYAHGAYVALAAPYPVHRLGQSLGVRSLRAGPSLGKLALDLLLARALRRSLLRARPDWIVAHHVEAAAACVLAGIPRFAFVAHTSLEEELHFYLHPRLEFAARRAGASVDRFLCRRATRVFAVAPELARELAARSDAPVNALRLPWPLPPATQSDERARARTELGLAPDDEVVLYAGNLDAYQGLSVLARSLAELAHERPRLKFLLATQAPSPALRRDFPPRYTQQLPLATEADRRRVHAAADVVVVPRASAAGLPVKLLDALARGARVVAARRAAAGLALGDATCTLVDGDDPQALSAAIARELRGGDRARPQEARAYIARTHSNAAFLDDFLRGLGAQSGSRPSPPRTSTDPLAHGDKVLERP
jgi:glycosyltransferase involved in cell wall biosynthesis